MNLRHAAALALVGWYIMAPRLNALDDTQMSHWIHGQYARRDGELLMLRIDVSESTVGRRDMLRIGRPGSQAGKPLCVITPQE